MKKRSIQNQHLKKAFALGLAALLTVGLLAGCGVETADAGESEQPAATEPAEETPVATASAEETANESAAPVETDEVVPTEVAVPSETAEVPAGTTIDMSDSGAVVTGEGAAADGNDVTITGGGTYTVSGLTIDGSIVVNAPGEDVTISLNGTNITSAGGPAIMIEDAASAVLHLADGSQNILQGYSAAVGDAATEDISGEAPSADESTSTDEPTRDAADETADEPADEPAEESADTAMEEPGADNTATVSIYDGAALYSFIPYSITGGGSLYAAGSDIITPSGESQNYLVYAFDEVISAGSVISIRQDDLEVFGTTVTCDTRTILYSDSLLEAGATYDVYVDNTVAGSASVVSSEAASVPGDAAVPGDTADETTDGDAPVEADIPANGEEPAAVDESVVPE